MGTLSCHLSCHDIWDCCTLSSPFLFIVVMYRLLCYISQILIVLFFPILYVTHVDASVQSLFQQLLLIIISHKLLITYDYLLFTYLYMKTC